MALKSIVLSDLSGDELDDTTHARVVVKHPDYSQLLELDISTDEAGKLQSSTLRMIELTVYSPNQAPRQVVIETKVLDKLFDNVDLDKVLQGARRAEAPAAPAARGRKSSAPKADKGDKIDYTAPEHFGQLHRGRVTDEEKALVRNNQDQASKNRQAQTGKPIDWTDAKEKARYGL